MQALPEGVAGALAGFACGKPPAAEGPCGKNVFFFERNLSRFVS
jgi:hypothetical protein